METELARIAEVAKKRPKVQFTSLVHLINRDTLMACHDELKPGKAPGVDGMTRKQYGDNLAENVDNLVARMKNQAYKPQPVRRTWIPKPGSDQKRPLGIPAYEDKLVQMAVAKILNAIYEADFLPCSFGFRPDRGCHDALKILNVYLEKRNTNYVVDADIKGFFDHVDHQWMMKFLEHRIKDRNLLRLVARFLRSGVMEAGITRDTPVGTPQGGVVSPILANVYLHYVLDLWFDKEVRKKCRGHAYMVRYADDFVCCFEYQEEASAFHTALKERLAKFNLEMAEDKTRIIRFGRNAKAGDDKPDTFDFLGFTHYCDKSRKGQFRVKRRTSRKKYRISLMRAKEWIHRQRHLTPKEFMPLLAQKLLGYYGYYAITDNTIIVGRFHNDVRRILFKALNRRSQRRSYTWAGFERFLKYYPLPRPRVLVNIYDLRLNLSYTW